MEKIKTTVIDDNFLINLTEIAKQYGWNGDYFEIRDFVIWCYKKANKDIVEENLIPYEIEK